MTPRAHLPCLLLLLASCASVPGRPPATTASSEYGGKCSFVRLEQLDGPGDEDFDATAFVARYRFVDGTRHRDQPLELFFQVSRSRVHDLSEHLQAHAVVLCTPDRIDVPPFEGQRGTIVD